MNKLLQALILLVVVLWIGFGVLILNPQLPLSQKVLPMFNIDAVLSVPPVAVIHPPQATGIDLTNCISYFDGCNHCSVKDGKADACTLMYCETPSEPKCLEYTTENGSTGAKSDTPNITGQYTIKDWSLYFGQNKLYGDTFKKCSNNGWWLFFQASTILLETQDYVLFNVKSWPCESDWIMRTMLLDKKDKISNMISLWNKLYSYNRMVDNTLYINQYNWWALGQWGEIEPQWFYEGYDCPECWIILQKELIIPVNNLPKYITWDVKLIQ